MNEVFSFEESSETRSACCCPCTPNHHPSFDIHDAIVSACPENLTIETGWPKDAPDGFPIELESIRGNQWKLSGIHAFGKHLGRGPRCSCSSVLRPPLSAKAETRLQSWRRPKLIVPYPRDDCSHLVGLKLCHGEPFDFSITEATTPVRCSFQPAMHRIPSNSLDSSYSGLVQDFDTEGGNLIKDRTTVLESIIGVPLVEQNVFPQLRQRYRHRFPQLVV